MYAWYPLFGVKTPTLTQSPIPRFLPSQRPFLLHPTGFHQAPCQWFQFQTDTKYEMLSFPFGRGIPMPLINILLPACHHHNYPISLTLQLSNTLPTNNFNAGLIMSAAHSVFHLAGNTLATCESLATGLSPSQTPHQFYPTGLHHAPCQ